MPTITSRTYDEAAAKVAYLQQLADIAATQDLSEDQRSRTRSLSIIFTVLAAAFVGLRFTSRWRQCVRVGTDDWLILFALVLLVGNMIMNFELINQGLGLHSGALTLEELQRLNQTVLGAEILYVTAVNMYKLSLLFLYWRIFPVKSIRVGSYICGGLSTCWNLACIFAATFQCTPRERLWMPWLEGTCINLFLTQLCISVPSILCDMAILCLPLPHVWRLKTNLTQRILVMFIFSLGSYVVFTSIYRLKVFLLYRTDDMPYTLADGCIWNVIEISSGIVSSCLPTLGSIVKLIFTSTYTSAKSSRNHPLGSSAQKRSNIVTIGGTGGALARTSNRWKKADERSREEAKYGATTEDLNFVPFKGKTVVTVSHDINRSWNGSSNDDIPLTGIRQQRQVEWTEERAENPLQGHVPSDGNGTRSPEL